MGVTSLFQIVLLIEYAYGSNRKMKMQADLMFDIYAERQKAFMIRLRSIFRIGSNRAHLKRKIVLITDNKG